MYVESDLKSFHQSTLRYNICVFSKSIDSLKVTKKCTYTLGLAETFKFHYSSIINDSATRSEHSTVPFKTHRVWKTCRVKIAQDNTLRPLNETLKCLNEGFLCKPFLSAFCG